MFDSKRSAKCAEETFGRQGSYITENQWNREFKKRLSLVVNGDVWKVNDRITPGISDFIVFLNGLTAFIESKRDATYRGPKTARGEVYPANLLTAPQWTFLKRRAYQGHPAFIAVSFKDCAGGAMFWQVFENGQLSDPIDCRFSGWAAMVDRFANVLEAT